MLSMKIFQRLKNRLCPFLRIERIRLEDYQAYILLRLQVFRLRLGILTYKIFCQNRAPLGLYFTQANGYRTMSLDVQPRCRKKHCLYQSFIKISKCLISLIHQAAMLRFFLFNTEHLCLAGFDDTDWFYQELNSLSFCHQATMLTTKPQQRSYRFTY